MSILNASATGIFRRKPVDEIEPEELEEGGGLQHVLGPWQLTGCSEGSRSSGPGSGGNQAQKEEAGRKGGKSSS